jgi:hypothetical protein
MDAAFFNYWTQFFGEYAGVQRDILRPNYNQIDNTPSFVKSLVYRN